MADTKVVTGECRASFVHVFEKFSNDPENIEPSYSIKLLIPKTDKKTMKSIEAAQELAVERFREKNGQNALPKNYKSTLKDGDESNLDKYPEDEGHWTISTRAFGSHKPGVVDQALRPILDDAELYSGCYVRASVQAFAYSNKMSKGVSFALLNVQKLKDGDPLGAVAPKAEDDFEAVESDAGDDDEDLL